MNSTFYLLWLPIILIVLASILKIIKDNSHNGKPFIRIEKEENNE